jgi:hypothetical protein
MSLVLKGSRLDSGHAQPYGMLRSKTFKGAMCTEWGAAYVFVQEVGYS